MASPTRHPLLSYQPLRLFFQLSYWMTMVACLPYWATVALIPQLRPDPTWTAKQTFMTRFVYSMLDIESRIGITETLTLKPGKEGSRFQSVSPSALDVYKGPLASKTVRPVKIGGTWFPDAPSKDALKSKNVVLYFHGGAFIQGDGRDPTCGMIAKRLLTKGGADFVFSVQYRLSGHGGLNPFPAALQDALSAYLFLLNDLSVPAGQIIVGGDSAGGNLATALLRYLHEYGTKISTPSPKCAVLLSSWVAPFHYHMSDNPHRGTDFVPTSFPFWGANSYGGGRPDAEDDPYITPLGHPFPTKTPIFASAGAAEMFHERILQWADEMRGVEGNVVEVYREDGVPHDSFLTGELLGFEKSAWEVAEKVGEFVSRC